MGERKKPGPKPGTTRKVPGSGGSRKGCPNKNTKALKDMILGALEGVGGQEYLQEQALINPGPFLSLIGKVLPTELKHQGGMSIQVITGVPHEPLGNESPDSRGEYLEEQDNG